MKKMLLVDPHESWQRYRLLLDQEIQKVLSRSDLNEDEKLYQYLSLLKRFISSKQQQQQQHKNIQTDNLFQKGEDKGVQATGSVVVDESTPTVQTVVPSSERSIQTEALFSEVPSIMTRSQSVGAAEERQIRQSLGPMEKDNFSKEKVVASIFHEYRTNAKFVVDTMHDPEKQSNIDFNPDTGELIIAGKTLPGSNIVEHLKYLLYSRPGTKPQHFDKFAHEMKRLKIPNHIVGNQAKSLWQQQQGSGSLCWI